MKKFKSLREAKVKASDYNATSEKSKFGGHRPKVVHKTKGTTMYLGSVGLKTPKAAAAAADAYLTGYAISGENGAKRMMNAHIKNNKKNLVDPSVLDTMESVDEAAKENWIDGVKYQKLKKMKGFNKADWEWNSSKQLYKKVKEDVQEAVELDENQVMSAQFKVGDMPNSDLHTSIEKLKTAKKKADAQKPKVSDPVLVKSLNDVISEIDKTIKDAEKAQATASKAIAKVAPSIKRTFELINRKKYLVASTGNQLDESINLKEAFNIEKGTNVKMKAGSDKDLYGKVIKQIKVNGKPGVTVQWKNGVKGNFRMDQFAAVSMDRKADYQVQDDGVRF